MLKDFLPVEGLDGNVSDIDFVEKFWTKQLSSNLARTLENDLENRDEYKVMSPYIRSLPHGSKVLDGGCGAGEWTVFFAKRGLNVTGLDISEKLISKLKEMFPDIKWLRGDLRQTGLAEASMDAVFSWGAFEHFEVGLAPCLTEARRIIKPGGLLFFSVPFANRRQLKLRSGDNDVNKPGMRFYQWRFTREDLDVELNRNGWQVLEILPVSQEHGLWRMLKNDYHIDLSFLPTLQRVMLRLLGFVVSADYAAHMVMAVARRP